VTRASLAGTDVAAIPVPGILVAKAGLAGSAMFDVDGEPVIIVGTQGKRLGTIVHQDHRIARDHGGLFEPLVIEPDYDVG
jgi:hypothetical protein